jgi:chromosome partitioning protein
MHVLSFVNQKGGCGKTTVAVHLSGALAARGDRVLLVDLDPQAHATLGLGCAPAEEQALGAVLLGRTAVANAIHTAPGGIHLLPATARLTDFEERAERAIRPERVLFDVLSELETRYDWVLLDCPPRIDGLLCANALRASTVAMLVVETGAFALQGALQAEPLLEEARTARGYGFHVLVLATMFDKRLRIARELLVALQARFGPRLLNSVIRTSVRLREAPAHALPVQVLDPASRSTADFAALAEELALREAAGPLRAVVARPKLGRAPVRPV